MACFSDPIFLQERGGLRDKLVSAAARAGARGRQIDVDARAGPVFIGLEPVLKQAHLLLRRAALVKILNICHVRRRSMIHIYIWLLQIKKYIYIN